MKREVAAYKALSSLAIVNYYENIPVCYEKFDKMRKRK